MFDFFGISFSESVLIWGNWNYKLNEELISRENPGIVFIMMIESNLKYVLHKHPSDREEEN